MYFDTHAHYDDSQFDPDRNDLLADLPQQGVSGVINAGACLKSSQASIALAEAYPYIYAAVGIHPHNVLDMTERDLDAIQSLCKHERNVAIGEIGLDYHYDHAPRDVQRHWFARQLALAKSLDMPVIIHSREAAAETMEIIKDIGVCKGVLHCYSGHLSMALEYIEMGFYISLGGVVTYKNADKTRVVAAGIPLDRLLIETDAPYLSPVPFRGKRNDSINLPYVVKAIAEAREITPEAVAEATAKNARRLFLA
ncbi:MAG: TatD family hydrolase [Defluviitaleaceae bacterium]|nr:TatD family hydrolase [Defluviitaleaceae bacterium]